ncbi:hypothetical protein C8R47DRAFT_153768 [Mycena vitilis]|nr:hypothetical protein C8R47DRAFT_153768 [Mycena vitilis]
MPLPNDQSKPPVDLVDREDEEDYSADNEGSSVDGEDNQPEEDVDVDRDPVVQGHVAVSGFLDNVQGLSFIEPRVGKGLREWDKDLLDQLVFLTDLVRNNPTLPVPRFDYGSTAPSRSMMATVPTPGSTDISAGSVHISETEAAPLLGAVVDNTDPEGPSDSAAAVAPILSPSTTTDVTSALPVIPRYPASPLVLDASDGSVDVFFDCDTVSIRLPFPTLDPSALPAGLTLDSSLALDLSNPWSDSFDDTISSLPPFTTAQFHTPPIGGASDFSAERHTTSPSPVSADPGSLDSPKGVPSPSSSERMAFLYSHGEDSMPNSSFWGPPPTLQDLLSKPSLMRPISTALENKAIPARGPRAIELRVPSPFTHVVLLLDLPGRLDSFIQTVSPGDPELTKLRLTDEEVQRMDAGNILANCSPEVKSEADVEYVFKAAQGHPVAEALNIVEGRKKGPRQRQEEDQDRPNRFYPFKGTPGSRFGGFHAYTDVQLGRLLFEIKTIASLGADFMARFLDLEPSRLEQLLGNKTSGGFLFAFGYPTSFRARMGSAVQPVIQIWTQFHEKGFSFGQGSSHEFTVHAIRDPENPHRLYLSLCYPTVFKTHPIDPFAENRGLLTTFNLARIANNPDWAAGFLKELREDMDKDGNLTPVYSQDVALVGRFKEEWREQVPTANVSKGTVGVKYYDQVNSKQGPQRKRKRKAPQPTDVSFPDESRLLAQVHEEESAPSAPAGQTAASDTRLPTALGMLDYSRPKSAVPAASGSGTQAHPQRPFRPAQRQQSKRALEASKTSPAITRSRRVAATIPSGGAPPPAE